MNTQELWLFAGAVRNAALSAMGIDYQNVTDTQAQRIDLAVQQVIEHYEKEETPTGRN